jgi:hypothetical protein
VQDEAELALTFPEPGSFRIAVDLVSEGVCWFELAGSKPAHADISVLESAVREAGVAVPPC